MKVPDILITIKEAITRQVSKRPWVSFVVTLVGGFLAGVWLF